jgi:hypothetical protein
VVLIYILEVRVRSLEPREIDTTLHRRVVGYGYHLDFI